jgi:hypothetical protein
MSEQTARTGPVAAFARAKLVNPALDALIPSAREVISHLLRSRRKTQLVELALRMGVA